jgi:hypothetical protein
MYGIPVVSSEQDNNSVLSGLKATRYTGPLCPWRILLVSAERSSIMRTNTSSINKAIALVLILDFTQRVEETSFPPSPNTAYIPSFPGPHK